MNRPLEDHNPNHTHIARNEIPDELIDPVLRTASALAIAAQNTAAQSAVSVTTPGPQQSQMKATPRKPVNTADELARIEASKYAVTGKRERVRRTRE